MRGLGTHGWLDVCKNHGLTMGNSPSGSGQAYHGVASWGVESSDVVEPGFGIERDAFVWYEIA